MDRSRIERTCKLSVDRRYRYELTRRWGPRPGFVWVMLNPSTADHQVDDTTVRRCMQITERAGGDALCIVNLYAYRATKPAELWKADDPIGPHNDRAIARVLDACSGQPWQRRVVCAWGAHAEDERVDVVLGMMREYRVLPAALGLAKGGVPYHPLARVKFEGGIGLWTGAAEGAYDPGLAREAARQVAACEHPHSVHGVCVLCGGLKCDDGTWEPPMRPSGRWNRELRRA